MLKLFAGNSGDRQHRHVVALCDQARHACGAGDRCTDQLRNGNEFISTSRIIEQVHAQYALGMTNAGHSLIHIKALRLKRIQGCDLGDKDTRHAHCRLCSIESWIFGVVSPSHWIETKWKGANEIICNWCKQRICALDDVTNIGARTCGNRGTKGLQPVISLAGESEGKRLLAKAVNQSAGPEVPAQFGHVRTRSLYNLAGMNAGRGS